MQAIKVLYKRSLVIYKNLQKLKVAKKSKQIENQTPNTNEDNMSSKVRQVAILK